MRSKRNRMVQIVTTDGTNFTHHSVTSLDVLTVQFERTPLDDQLTIRCDVLLVFVNWVVGCVTDANCPFRMDNFS